MPSVPERKEAKLAEGGTQRKLRKPKQPSASESARQKQGATDSI